MYNRDTPNGRKPGGETQSNHNNEHHHNEHTKWKKLSNKTIEKKEEILRRKKTSELCVALFDVANVGDNLLDWDGFLE